MVNFPVFERIDISGYGLFPGIENSAPGLHANFQPGLTMILGANGLGKTTLVSIIYRLLTGPFDIPGLTDNSELGYVRLTPTRLPPHARKAFAYRVVDNARNAYARLSFKLGLQSVVIERRLSDLALTQFIVDDQPLLTDEEKIFQVEIPRLANVLSFSDWILLLRYLVFYFEDRRALVWDPSAQRQILRILFLPSSTASQWTTDERTILELDSSMRNLNAILGRQQRELTRNEAKIETGVDVRDELATLESLQKADSEIHERLEKEALEVDEARQKARLKALKAEQEREAKYRTVERIRLLSIATRFPEQSETARYILAQLLANQDCIVCGNHVPQIANEYTARIDHKQCVVCGSNLADLDGVSSANIEEIDNDVTQAIADLQLAENYVAESHLALTEAESNYHSHVQQISEVAARINNQSRRIDLLVRELPPEEAEMHEQRSMIAVMRGRAEEIRAELSLKRESFGKFIEEINRDLVKWKDAIKESFNSYAEGFLLEQCDLIWSPQKRLVGQTGSPVMFPAFELDMAGANIPTLVRRSGPEQVSESQREFIDLAFRMALMSVSTDGGSSLVMDAPESSLDAVFSSRAATVLSRFATSVSGNRLVITSNLVEGQLIPDLIHQSTKPEDRAGHVVDLVTIAAPTVAVREHRREYEIIRDKILASPNMEGSS